MICILVAGGSSRRMVEDKLLIPLGGVPMACRVVEVLREAGCSEVVSVGRRLPCTDTWIPDDKRLPCGGPARGLATAAELVSGWEEVFIAPGDAGLLEPGVPRRLRELARILGAETASPYWEEGFIDSLIAYTRGSALSRIREACSVKEEWGCRTRATDLHRASSPLLLAGAGVVAGDPVRLARLNTPVEAADPRPPGTPPEDVRLLEGHAGYYLEAIRLLGEGSPLGAAEMLAAEARLYAAAGQPLLELHSLIDVDRLGAGGGAASRAARIAGLSLLLGRRPRAVERPV